ncbi:IS110 family transposase [Piscinibacter sp.]|jgi:transposase|uniref:IS110 family transposase n=1 Tax=Piscinibacter sp. TaxID=1903157 RepID=UPI002F41E8B1
MKLTQTGLQSEDTAAAGALYMSFELGDKTWKLTFGDGRRGPSRFTVAAGDKAAVLQCIAKAKSRARLEPQALVHSCYEAGRDGWWLHRWLNEQGIHNIVVDSSSIEVHRRARRAKTDRLDGDKLLAMLLRYHGGETRVWSVVHEPTLEDEDARRVHRELQRLKRERTAHTNRIAELLVLHNLRPGHVCGSDWRGWWDAHQSEVPPLLRAEIERECERLELVKRQIQAIDKQRRQELAHDLQPAVAQLAKLRAIGLQSAWVLAKELFEWRHFANRRELAASVGLTPTPYNSGGSQIEQGIGKAGNKRVRTLLVELSWMWLRLQPDSDLTHWFDRRFAAGSKRMRRVGIVALARRLLIALWRFFTDGVIPAGAQLKPAGR